MGAATVARASRKSVVPKLPTKVRQLVVKPCPMYVTAPRWDEAMQAWRVELATECYQIVRVFFPSVESAWRILRHIPSLGLKSDDVEVAKFLWIMAVTEAERAGQWYLWRVMRGR